MLAGFQGHPWPLLRIGPLEARGSEMCVFLTGSGTYREEEVRAEREMASAEALFVMTRTGPSTVGPVNGAIDFTHIVDPRASPRQEGGDPLASDGCLNIVTPKQAEEEEMEGSPRTGTTQLPAFPLGPRHHTTSEKGVTVEVAPSAGRVSIPEHLTHLFGSSSSLQDLSRSQVVHRLAFSFAMGT